MHANLDRLLLPSSLLNKTNYPLKILHCVKKVAADNKGDAVMYGYLDIRELKFKGRKVIEGKAVKPLRRWMVLRRDFCLYSYKHSSDSRALAAIVLLNSAIHHGQDDLADDEFVTRDSQERVVKMFQRSHHTKTVGSGNGGGGDVKRVYYFEAKSPRDASK